VAFCIASGFSSVAEESLLWGLPVLGILSVLLTRIYLKQWPAWQAWSCGLGGAVIVLGGFVCGAHFISLEEPRLSATTTNIPLVLHLTVKQNNAVIVGTNANNGAVPDTWVLIPAKSESPAVSMLYPRDFRAYAQECLSADKQVPQLGIANTVAGLPSLKGRSLAVIGALSKAEWEALAPHLLECEKLFLVTPNISPKELRLPAQFQEKIDVIFGEFSSQPTAIDWQHTPGFRQIEGVGDFFQNWPELVFTTLK
jgi:hypothetical protein